MKKIYSFIATALLAASAFAQTATPNGGFEAWNSTTCDGPVGFVNSNPEAIFRCGAGCNIIKTTDFYSGAYAVQLNTILTTDTCFGYIVSSPNPNGGNPCAWQGGIPISQTPTGLRGYYKNNVTSPDSNGVLVAFRKAGNCLGLYMYKFGGTHSSYTPFAFTFNPPLAQTPDTMIFAAISSDVFSGVALNGSMLQLDSVSLTGMTQPAALNGSFENWQPMTIETPVSWYNMGGGGNGIGAVTKTTDFKFGQYAVQLTTYQGDNNGVPRAQAGGISTGYYLNNCQGPNCQKGGYPFTNQVDTLCLYYKYAPLNGDTANVWMNFKLGGNQVWGTGSFIPNAASSYTYKEIPFNTMGAIDSVIISIVSSDWNDSTLASVGTVLKVDDVHFKSTPSSGIRNYDASAPRTIYPNPNNGVFMIENVDKHDLVRILNVYGEEVDAFIDKQNGTAQVRLESAGVYLVYINARGKVSQQRVVVGK